MNENTAYSSLCKLNIHFLLKLQKWLIKSSERFPIFWCLFNINDRQQEYWTAVTLRAAQIQYTVLLAVVLGKLLKKSNPLQMTNYFFTNVIWLHYWLLHLKSNQITNYFTFKLLSSLIYFSSYQT